MLNKTTAYSTNKIVKNNDPVIKYSLSNKKIFISIEKKITKPVAEILLKLAQYVGAKIIISGKKILESADQLG